MDLFGTVPISRSADLEGRKSKIKKNIHHTAIAYSYFHLQSNTIVEFSAIEQPLVTNLHALTGVTVQKTI